MISFSKAQLQDIHVAYDIVDSHKTDADEKNFVADFTDSNVLFYAKLVYDYHTDYMRYYDLFLNCGGESWLEMMANSRLLCLRNLRRLIRELS